MKMLNLKKAKDDSFCNQLISPRRLACSEIRERWLPARIEQVYQRDRYTLRWGYARSISGVARYFLASLLSLYRRPPRAPDTFTFSQQLLHQLWFGTGLQSNSSLSALWICSLPVVQGKPPSGICTSKSWANTATSSSHESEVIITAAHQVSQQSSVRPIQTGQPRTTTPALLVPSHFK